jgi:hypothetical protein
MKIPGVSFTAKAKPTSMPRGRRVRAGIVSAKHAPTNRIPTWPNQKTLARGVVIATATTSAASTIPRVAPIRSRTVR